MIFLDRAVGLGALLLLACGPTKGTGDATDATTAADSSGSTGPATGTTAPTGGLTGTTGEATTGDATTGDATTDDASTGPPPVCREWHEYTGCPIDFPTATDVRGEGLDVDFPPITTIYFGVFGWACQPGNAIYEFRVRTPDGKELRFDGDPPDTCGPEGWFGEHPVIGFGSLGPGSLHVTATLTIDGFAGDWDSEAPVDPPRILGHMSGELVGPVEAIRCDLLDIYVNNCA